MCSFRFPLVTVLKAALSLVEHPERHVSIGLYGGNRFHEHGFGFVGSAQLPLLRECGDRDCEDCG
jgi:hypothetical protein